MAVNKSKSKEVKKTAKTDSVSLEEISRKKEEVLKRIDAEIGKSEEESPEAEEKIEEENTDAEMSKKEDAIGGGSEEKRESLESEEVKEEEKEAVSAESEPDTVGKSTESEPEKEEVESKKEEVKGPFSAAEFGITDRGGNKKFINVILFAAVFIIVALVSAGFYFYNVGGIFSPKTDQAEVVPTDTPTPTPTPVFNREEISVQVLNGSGAAGVAGAAEKVLEDKGYANIEIGNAEEFDYENVTIQLKSKYSEFFEDIKKDLEDNYTVNDTYEELDEESEFDVVIIVGKVVADSGE